MKQLLKTLKNYEKVIFRIKGSNSASITNDKLIMHINIKSSKWQWMYKSFTDIL